ncbi:hypothetical protein DENSPDRAFT_422992 [Dentipellis sp. KUC8613]|nr:hypothetical protein DENSPDRAFT_422992 [Dentipellis sp. KUC8613]
MRGVVPSKYYTQVCSSEKSHFRFSARCVPMRSPNMSPTASLVLRRIPDNYGLRVGPTASGSNCTQHMYESIAGCETNKSADALATLRIV